MFEGYFSEIKPSVYNFVIIGLTAVLFITLGKYLFAKWDVPGVSEIFAAA